MKVRVKRSLLILIAGLIIGGSTVYAGGNYYADLLGNQEEQIKSELMDYYEEQHKHRSEQVHHDLVTFVEMQRQDLIDYFKPIIDEQVNIQAQQRQNEHAEAVEQKVKELREKIYEMLEEELGNQIPRG